MSMYRSDPQFLEQALLSLPVFSNLDIEAVKELASIAGLEEAKRGDIIYKEGDSPDNLYVVISGRIKAYTQKQKEEGDLLEYLYRGTCFGIISLLTGDKHSVTAEVVNDSLLAVISREKFDNFLKKHPNLSLGFSRMLSMRVKKRVDKDKHIFESSVIAVYRNNVLSNSRVYSFILSKALVVESRKKAVVVRLRGDKAVNIPGSGSFLDLSSFNEAKIKELSFSSQGFDSLKVGYTDPLSLDKSVSRLLGGLTEEYNFVFLDLFPGDNNFNAACLTQADFIHFLSIETSPFLRGIPKKVRKFSRYFRLGNDKVKVVVCGQRHSKERKNINGFLRYLKDFMALGGYEVLSYLPGIEDTDFNKIADSYPNTGFTKEIRRLARELSGVRIGIALGSGAAFGMAHIGVIKVLEELGLDDDIDIVAGTSMGAVIAVLWGLGRNWKEMRDAVSVFKKVDILSFLDIGFTWKSLLAGRNFRRILNKMFPRGNFYGLKKPVSLACFDFKRRASRYIYGGNIPLRKAVLASCSFPGIFSPVKNESELLLDGGVLNPLPVKPLVKQGVKKIIAVNITPSKEDIKREYSSDSAKVKLNILDFIFGSIEAMQQEFVGDAVSLSDVAIHPEFSGVSWTDFKNIDYFIERGEKAALKKVEEIKEIIKG